MFRNEIKRCLNRYLFHDLVQLTLTFYDPIYEAETNMKIMHLDDSGTLLRIESKYHYGPYKIKIIDLYTHELLVELINGYYCTTSPNGNIVILRNGHKLLIIHRDKKYIERICLNKHGIVTLQASCTNNEILYEEQTSGRLRAFDFLEHKSRSIITFNQPVGFIYRQTNDYFVKRHLTQNFEEHLIWFRISDGSITNNLKFPRDFVIESVIAHSNSDLWAILCQSQIHLLIVYNILNNHMWVKPIFVNEFIRAVEWIGDKIYYMVSGKLMLWNYQTDHTEFIRDFTHNVNYPTIAGNMLLCNTRNHCYVYEI